MATGAERTVEVRLFGALAERFGPSSAFQPAGRLVVVDDTTCIGDILRGLGIAPEDVRHLFLNGQYSAVSRRVKPGDRLGIFGRDMALLYRQYFPVVQDAP
jgi:hypothetical protein